MMRAQIAALEISSAQSLEKIDELLQTLRANVPMPPRRSTPRRNGPRARPNRCLPRHQEIRRCLSDQCHRVGGGAKGRRWRCRRRCRQGGSDEGRHSQRTYLPGSPGSRHPHRQIGGRRQRIRGPAARRVAGGIGPCRHLRTLCRRARDAGVDRFGAFFGAHHRPPDPADRRRAAGLANGNKSLRDPLSDARRRGRRQCPRGEDLQGQFDPHRADGGGSRRSRSSSRRGPQGRYDQAGR